jgi:hypothetical protein
MEPEAAIAWGMLLLALYLLLTGFRTSAGESRSASQSLRPALHA